MPGGGEMNRKQRRKIERAHPVSAPEGLQHATIDMRLKAAPALRGPKTREAFTAHGRTDFELWANVIGEMLSRMGYNQPSLAVGMLLDMVNRWPDELRGLLATGIVRGLGLQMFTQEATVCDKCKAQALDPREFKHEEGCEGKEETRELLQAVLDPTYNPLPMPEKGAPQDLKKTPGGLYLP